MADSNKYAWNLKVPAAPRPAGEYVMNSRHSSFHDHQPEFFHPHQVQHAHHQIQVHTDTSAAAQYYSSTTAATGPPQHGQHLEQQQHSHGQQLQQQHGLVYGTQHPSVFVDHQGSEQQRLSLPAPPPAQAGPHHVLPNSPPPQNHNFHPVVGKNQLKSRVRHVPPPPPPKPVAAVFFFFTKPVAAVFFFHSI